jgi:hypothetical protein
MFRMYTKNGLDNMQNNVLRIGISGIIWNQLVIERKAVK